MAAIRHGKQCEGVASKQYQERYQYKIKPVVLYISILKPYLAASPDRILDTDTLIETKCPYAAKDELIIKVSVSYLNTIDGKLMLDPEHPYYCPVKGQMMVKGKPQSIIIVYTRYDLKTFDINGDAVFRKAKKLDEFFWEVFPFDPSPMKPSTRFSSQLRQPATSQVGGQLVATWKPMCVCLSKARSLITQLADECNSFFFPIYVSTVSIFVIVTNKQLELTCQTSFLAGYLFISTQ